MVEEDAEVDPGDRVLDVGIVEHDVGALATEFEGDLLEVGSGGCLHDGAANDGAAREGDLINVHVRRHGRPRGLTEAGKDVDDARWEASLFDELGGIEGTERSLLGGLEDNDVAAGNGRPDLPGPHEEREVPWDDLAADTDLDGGTVSLATLRDCQGSDVSHLQALASYS